MLVVAFFAAPAMADCTGSTMADFNAGDMSFGAWPANMNLDFVSSGEQKAFAFWHGDAANALDVKKDQTAGMVYEDFDTPLRWDTRVINIEKISSGNQFATATGYATAKNSISVCSTQGTAAGCDC